MDTLVIGTYTQPEPHVLGRAAGIYLYQFDPEAGTLTHQTTITGVVNPSFVTSTPNGRFIYAVNEISSAETGGGRVDAFELAQTSAETRHTNTQSSGGLGPCYASIATGGKQLLIANYSSGSIAVLPILPDGSLGPATDTIAWQGGGPNPDRQEAPHAHMILSGPDARIYAVDLGTDQVYIYELDQAAGKLHPADQPTLTLPPGSGPRHLTFGRLGRDLYVITELDNRIVRFEQNETGQYQQRQIISTLPADFTAGSSCAAVRLAPSGRYLYASNRGHDSIAIFHINAATGAISAEGHAVTNGRAPRDFIITPDGAHLLAANQDSSSITLFSINRDSGQLHPIGDPIPVDTPVCLQWLNV